MRKQQRNVSLTPINRSGSFCPHFSNKIHQTPVHIYRHVSSQRLSLFLQRQPYSYYFVRAKLNDCSAATMLECHCTFQRIKTFCARFCRTRHNEHMALLSTTCRFRVKACLAFIVKHLLCILNNYYRLRPRRIYVKPTRNNEQGSLFLPKEKELHDSYP
jgi:hypothetical protein